MAFIKINKQNFFHNLNQIALQTGSVEKIAIVLKDNAYGHGLALMAELASEYGVTQAVVRTISEAKIIEQFFSHILILGDRIIKHKKYSFAINSIADIAHAVEGAKVELKVDTGMHRNGITIDELEDALEQINKKSLDLLGVMTHYRSADVLSSEFFWQQKNFEEVKSKVKKSNFNNVRFHSHNSASILRTKNFDEDLVRVGIGAYGYNELPEPFDKIKLKPVLSLHARKTSTRKVKKGQRVGYGGTYESSSDMHISTYDLGYGDGWNRGAYMTSEQSLILGHVSMGFISLASEKEEVCVMNNAQDAARQFGTISYEIITRLNSQIEKIVI